ncbi:MAG: hypothetical protein JWO03_2895 [Bacteroidetes bacterium]|nr:hypothetical protein [Bacteroidota bacterium]
MNLNYDQSPETLQALLATADENLPTHSIAVDYDGEVIVDPEIRYPDVDIKRYKFRTHIWNASIRSAKKLQALHAALMSVINAQPRTLGNSDYSIAA